MIQRLSLNSQCFGVLPECILNSSWKKMEKIFLWRINYTTNIVFSIFYCSSLLYVLSRFLFLSFSIAP